jgi:WD repeat-containing protein 19
MEWTFVIFRVNLEFLQNPDEAVRIVRETRSIDGAKMVAKFFEKLGDFSSAIQFLILSKCENEAFAMAQEHNQMDQYAEIVGDEASEDVYLAMAEYFVEEKQMLNAGKFFLKAGQHAKVHVFCYSRQHTGPLHKQKND